MALTALMLALFVGSAFAANRTLSSIAYPIKIQGNLLYDATGKRFFAKGVAYNPRNGNYGQVLGRPDPSCSPGTPKFQPLEYYADPASDEMEELQRDKVAGVK